MRLRSASRLTAGIGVLVLLAALVACSVGRFPIGPLEALRLIGAELGGQAHGLSPQAQAIFWSVRMPRVAAAVLVGAALAAAGTSLQTVFRNPLVSPDLLGVSAGAALGAVAGIFLGWGMLAVQVAAFLGGLAAVGAVWMLAAHLRLQDRSLGLILSGIAAGSMLGAAVAMIKTLADPQSQLPGITFWLMGSLTGISATHVTVLIVGLGLALLPLWLVRWRAEALSLADDEILTIGVDAARVRVLLITSATLATALTVAAAGMIGWIGLVVPHAARMLVGGRFSNLLPLSMALGALLLLVIDTLCRSATSVEIPPGVVTALVGGPVLFVLMTLRGRR